MNDLSRGDLLAEARTIAEDYQSKGYSLTLRQLYYQCVAAALIPNSDKSYKRLGDTLGNARLAGEFEMDLIVDRGRSAGGSKATECKLDVGEALDEAGRYVKSIPHWTIATDRWFGQSTHVSVWVEKDALSGVFEGPCGDLGVGFFACKGYPSHSALWEWLKKCEEANEAAGQVVELGDSGEAEPVDIDEAVVLYFGDHDPDGWQIPRSAEDALNTFARVHGLDVPPIRFERIALNMDQIRQYNPPPFPAKPSSARYDGYVREHGIVEAWELDALRPEILDRLIRTNVERFWRPDLHQEWQARATAARALLKGRMREPEWMAGVLR